MSPPTADERYLKPTEAAKYLHVSARTLDRWAAQGRIPCMVTLGGHRRFLLDDILVLAARMKTPVSSLQQLGETQ